MERVKLSKINVEDQLLENILLVRGDSSIRKERNKCLIRSSGNLFFLAIGHCFSAYMFE